MDEENQECQEKIASGEIDCATNIFNPCCFINDSGSSSGSSSSPQEFIGKDANQFFGDSFSKSSGFLDSIGIVEVGGFLAIAFVVSYFSSRW